MSDPEKQASSSNDMRIENIDPELDIRSELFNPIKALLSPEIQIPIKDAPLYNNVAHYESAMRKQQTGKDSKTAQQAAPKLPLQSYRQEVELHQRRFLPHQEMIKGHGKSARFTRNILLKMSGHYEGPTNMLKQWKDQRNRVKIFTRNANTINGHVIGFIEAFDKHWNIVLSDVFEVWKRKKYHHSSTAIPLNDDNDDVDALQRECLLRLKHLNIAIPTVNAKSVNRKLVECSRNVQKLLIRGEQIATIILDTIPPETMETGRRK